jgi:hypothetical protein
MRRNLLNQKTHCNWRMSAYNAKSTLLSRLGNLRGLQPIFFLSSVLSPSTAPSVKYFPVSSNGQNSRSFFSFLNFDIVSLAGLLYLARLVAILLCLFFVYYAVCVLALWSYTYFALFLYIESFCSVLIGIVFSTAWGVFLITLYYVVWYPAFLYYSLLCICYNFTGWVFYACLLLSLCVLFLFFFNFLFKLGLPLLPFNPPSLLASANTAAFLLFLGGFVLFNLVLLLGVGLLISLLYFSQNKSFFGWSTSQRSSLHEGYSASNGVASDTITSYTSFFFRMLIATLTSVNYSFRARLRTQISALLGGNHGLAYAVAPYSLYGSCADLLSCSTHALRAGSALGSTGLSHTLDLRVYNRLYGVFLLTSFFTPQKLYQLPLSIAPMSVHAPLRAVSVESSLALLSGLRHSSLFNIRGFSGLYSYTDINNPFLSHWQLAELLKAERLAVRSAGYAFAAMHTNFKFNVNFLLKLKNSGLSAGNFYSTTPLATTHSLVSSYDSFKFGISSLPDFGSTPAQLAQTTEIQGVARSLPVLLFYANTASLQYGVNSPFTTNFQNYDYMGDLPQLCDILDTLY